MPYLQLDLPRSYPFAVKRDLARKMGNLYAEIMQTTPDLVAVAFRELGDGNMWRCRDSEPVPGAVVSCEVRRGRPPEQRERLAAAIFDACIEALGLDPLILAVEFTQHAGDENYLRVKVNGRVISGLGQDWSPTEAETSMVDQMTARIGVSR
jgi:phenylpyruvate tautomerase PptA (4-oxalocrotonate tautomerase family)